MKVFKKISSSWWFFFSVLSIYIFLFIGKYSLFKNSFVFSLKIFLKILPLAFLVWIFMALVDRFLNAQSVMKYLHGGKRRGWIFAIGGGILSAGPIYMWYPLLADLHKKGLSYGLIACFLYNRSVKLPLLPLIIYYFGWKYVIVLTVVMVIASIGQGAIINKLLKENTST